MSQHRQRGKRLSLERTSRPSSKGSETANEEGRERDVTVVCRSCVNIPSSDSLQYQLIAAGSVFAY